MSQITKFEEKEAILRTIKTSQLQRAYRDTCEWLPTLPMGASKEKILASNIILDDNGMVCRSKFIVDTT